MGYAIIDRTTKYKGSKRIAHVTPKSPSGLINNALTAVNFSYGNIVDNKFNISSVTLQPASTTAPYRFELSALRTGVSINQITGEVEISSGFDGGTITIIAKDSSGEEVGRYSINGVSPISTDVYSDLQIISFAYNTLASYKANSTTSPTLTYSYKKNGILHTITKSTDATDATVEYSKTNDPDPSYATLTASTGVVKFTSLNDENSNRSCDVTVTVSLPGIQAETDAQSAVQGYYTAPVVQPEITVTLTASNISTSANTSNVYNVTTKGSVGTLQVTGVSGDTNHFDVTFSNNVITIITREDNTSGANYTATFRVGDGTYYQDIIVTQPFVVYYIDSVTYPDTITETYTGSGIYVCHPTIVDNEGNTYNSLADYNNTPGAQVYTLQGTRVISEQIPSGQGFVLDTTTGDIKYIVSELAGTLYYSGYSLIYQNSQVSSRKVEYSYVNQKYASQLLPFNSIQSEDWISMTNKNFYVVSESEPPTENNGKIYRVSSNNRNAYLELLGNVTAGDIIYIDLETVSADPVIRLYVVESSTSDNENKTVYYDENGTIKYHTISTVRSPRTENRDFIIHTMGRSYLDGGVITEGGVSKFKIAYIVKNTCNDAFIMLKWAANADMAPFNTAITNAIPSMKYYIQHAN